jgi:serine/threonine protein kinase
MQLKKSLSIFKRNLSNSSKILLGLGNMRIFTQEELNEITQNYSCLLSGGTSGKVYKGTLEDNTVVAVRIFSEALEGFEEAFINGGMILSQIVHKNIIRLLGYCLNADCPAFVYEYAARGTLSDILDGREDFPLHLRVKIAVETAEALEYLHSSAAGMIRHGYVAPSKTLVDDSFTPKLTGFSWAQRLNNDDSAIHDHDKYCVSLKLKTDVYQFGVLVLTLISRKNFAFYADHEHLVSQFLAAYKADNSGRAFFDDDITTRSEDVALLEEIGKLLLKCICLEIDQRPTMKQVAQHLRIIRRCWKNNCTADGASLVTN